MIAAAIRRTTARDASIGPTIGRRLGTTNSDAERCRPGPATEGELCAALLVRAHAC